MKPKFSVIIPLHNKAPYVHKALDSVMAQTFTDFELIIVDDGSTDNSASICEAYLKSLTRTFAHSLIRQGNSGVAAARNNGVAASSGDLLCFLDADDWWKPTFLMEMNKLIEAYPDAGLYATNYIYYKPGKTHVALGLKTGYINYAEAYLNSAAMPICTIATCMPRRVFDAVGGFPVGIKLGEDFLLWVKTALHYPVVFSEKPLAYYNNDVPASLRATRNLHAPQYHMLFNLDSIIDDLQLTPYTVHRDAWMRLFDKLRTSGLMDYWLSDEYHDAAAAELKKVDWSKQPKSAGAQYKKPIWLLKVKRWIMRAGSYCKQKLIKLYLFV